MGSHWPWASWSTNSTVTIENTHRLFEEGTGFDLAVLEGAAGIAVPTLISTLAICCVFVSLFFLEGAARYLFAPLGMAVVFAMIASYAISRTLTPVLIRLLLRGEHAAAAASPGLLARFHARLNRGFDRFREFYGWLLAGILRRRIAVPVVALGVVGAAAALALFVGTDFFPQVDAGLIQLHVRAAPRARIERTEQIFEAVERNIRQQIPARDLGLVLDNIGLPARLYNLAFTDGTTIGVNDGEILISLKPGHAPTADYIRKLRLELQRALPDVTFYFQPADMVTQILNFGVASPIDVQVQGQDRAGNIAVARALRERLAAVPGIVDAHVQQELDAPELHYTIDRTRAQQLGLPLQSIANNLNISLSSSEQVSPNFWTDPQNGIPYFLAVQTPEYRIASLNDLNNTPISSTSSTATPVPNLLGNVARVERRPAESVYNQSNIQPVYDVYANAQDSDLGGVARAIDGIVHDMQGQLKPGNRIVVRGQIASMDSAFSDLGLGLAFAAVFVYLLMVVNYQSFLDPLAVILGAARRRGRHPADALRHRHELERAVADGRHHVGGRRLGQFDPARHFRAREAARGPERGRGGAGGRQDPTAPRADDGGGDARRHDPDGAGRRRRRAERRAGAGRDRRSGHRHADDAALRALPLFHHRAPRSAASRDERRPSP